MKLSSPVAGGVLDFDPYNVRSATDPSHDLGALVELNDFRVFRHGKAGGSNISLGKLQLSAAPIANHHNMTVAAAAAGAVVVTCTPGATAGVAGVYTEGLAFINAGPGAGQQYRVSNNPTITASTAFILSLTDPIVTALTTSSKLTLTHNPYNLVVEAAVATRRAAGVPLVSVTAAYSAWFQTKGLSAVLADGAIGIGNDIIASTSVAGAVKVVDTTSAATATAQNKVGSASVVAGVDTEYRPMVLSID